MNKFTKKIEKLLVRASKKVQPSVGINPVVVPIVIVDSVLPNITGSRVKPNVERRKLIQVEDSTEKSDFI